MRSKKFWIRTGELAVRSFAQGILFVALGGSAADAVGFNVIEVAWDTALFTGSGYAVFSILTSILMAPVGEEQSPLLAS